MKTLHTTEPTQYPAFWDEECLRRAIEELDTRKMTPEERAYFARVTAANAEAVKAEKQRIAEAVEQKAVETLKTALSMGLTLEQGARLAGVPIEEAEAINRKLLAE